MTLKQFWTIFETAKQNAQNLDMLYENLRLELMSLETDELLCWANILEEYSQICDHSKLRAVCHMLCGWDCDDAFYAFRGWLIAQGWEIYHSVLSDPDSLAERISDDLEAEFDPMQAAASAFFQRLGIFHWNEAAFCRARATLLLPAPILEQLKEESACLPDLDAPWTEDQLNQLFPQLSNRLRQIA